MTNTLSNFATAMTQSQDLSQKFLKDPNTDIGDPDLANKFMDSQFQPMMDQVRAGIKTQAGQDAFDEHLDRWMPQFSQQFHRDLSAVSGIRADDSANNYINQQTSLIQ